MSFRSRWRRFHTWPRRYRWPIKIAVLTVAVVLVLYPKVWLIPVWARRLSDMNALVDSSDPALLPLEQALRAAVGADVHPEQLYAAVERIVCDRVPYAFDWEAWGVMDYLPTVDEVFRKGREDCDGRAVVAASLLRRLGQEAWLVSDLKHVWVVARDPAHPERAGVELMGPGAGEKTLVAEETGTRAVWTSATLANLGRGLSFGVAVFPLLREVILLIALCTVTLHPRASLQRRTVGCLLMVAALALVRWSGATEEMSIWRSVVLWMGVLSAICGWTALAVKSRPAVRSQAGDPRRTNTLR